MDDLKRFRDFRRWESQRADESYVKSVEEENRELQRTAELLPNLFDKRIEEMTRWMDARLREIQGSYNNKFESAIVQQNVKNLALHDKITALEAHIDDIVQQHIDSIETTGKREKEAKNQCERASTELRAVVEEKSLFARKELENKLSALSALIVERTDCLKAQEVRTQQHLLKVETDLTQAVESVDEATRKVASETIRLQDSINDVAMVMDALKEECESNIANESDIREKNISVISAEAIRLQKSIDDVALSTVALKKECEKNISAISAEAIQLQKSIDDVALNTVTLKTVCESNIASNSQVHENISTFISDLTLGMDALKEECESNLAKESQVRKNNILLEANRIQDSINDLALGMAALKEECESNLAKESQVREKHILLEANRIQDSINDLALGMDALKEECESNLAKESQVREKHILLEANRMQDSINDLALEINALKIGTDVLKKECENNLAKESQVREKHILVEANRMQDSINDLALEINALKIGMDVLKKECESNLAKESQVRESISMDATRLHNFINDVALNMDSLKKEYESNIAKESQAREKNILLAANRTQDSIDDLALEIHALKIGIDVLKNECESNLAKESERSASAREAICESLLSESDKRAEDGLRIAMRVEEMNKHSAQKEEVWAIDMRMVQETMHFKLQKIDEDLIAATLELEKLIGEHEAKILKVEGLANSTQEAFSSLDEKLSSFDKKQAALEEHITVVAAISEEATAKLKQQSTELGLLRRRKEGNMTFTWAITPSDMDKHEVRSPSFALREVDNLRLLLYPKGRLTSKPNFSAISLVRKRERTNPFECEEEPLRVTFTSGSVTSKVKELDAWDDEFDAAVAENFGPTVELCSEIIVTVV